MIVTSQAQLLRDIKAVLPVAQYQAVAVTDNGLEALRLVHRVEPDLLIMGWSLKGLPPDSLLDNLLEQRLCPVMTILAQDELNWLPEVVNAGAHQILLAPWRAHDFLAAVLVAERNFSHDRKMVAEIRLLEDELTTRRLVYRAVLTIIQQFGWEEEKAYAALRKRAMEKRKSLRTVAQEVIRRAWFPE